MTTRYDRRVDSELPKGATWRAPALPGRAHERALTDEAADTNVGGMPQPVQITINEIRLSDGWVDFDAVVDPPMSASARAGGIVTVLP